MTNSRDVHARVEVRIMGDSRRPNGAATVAERLGDARIFLDHGNGPVWSAAQAWSTPPDDSATHICVIQDDARVCDNFEQQVTNLAAWSDGDVVGLFGSWIGQSGQLSRIAELHAGNYIPAVGDDFGTVSVLMRQDVALAFGRYLASGAGGRQSDAAALRDFAALHDHPLRLTVPSLVQHDVPAVESLVSGPRKGIRRAAVYQDKIAEAAFKEKRPFELNPFTLPYLSSQHICGYVSTDPSATDGQRILDWLTDQGHDRRALVGLLEESGPFDRPLSDGLLLDAWAVMYAVGVLHGTKRRPPSYGGLETILPGAVHRVLRDEELTALAPVSHELANAALAAGAEDRA